MNKLRLVTWHSFEETDNVKNIILFFKLFCQISITVHYGRSPAKRIFQATRHWVIRTHCSPNSCFLTQSMRSVQLSSVPVFVYNVRRRHLTNFFCVREVNFQNHGENPNFVWISNQFLAKILKYGQQDSVKCYCEMWVFEEVTL